MQKVERSLSETDKEQYDSATSFLVETYPGTVLHAIAEDLALGRMVWGKDVVLEKGHVAIRYPKGFANTGCNPNELMEQLDSAEWIEHDPQFYVRKIQEIKGIGRALVLTAEISDVFQVIAKMPTKLTTARLEKRAPEKSSLSKKTERKTPTQSQQDGKHKPAMTNIAELPDNRPLEKAFEVDQRQEENVPPTSQNQSEMFARDKRKEKPEVEVQVLGDLPKDPIEAILVLLEAKDSPFDKIEIDGKQFAVRGPIYDWLKREYDMTFGKAYKIILNSKKLQKIRKNGKQLVGPK